MANIQGASSALPGVIVDVVTQSRGASVPGGIRVAAFIGEGARTEVVVSSAAGGGTDGLNPTYTSSSGSDGRHFQLSLFPLVSNRVKVFRNGVPLVGLEALIDSGSFNNAYDYRIDISTGRIELQKAYLVDQGGAFYVPLSTNVGTGVVNSLSLVDVNAPSETWTIRCVSVQRDAFNAPIASTAKFIAFGTISGAKLDANGNPVVWIANNQVVSNGILSFSISENSPPFREGDGFTIKVKSGVLSRNDSLTAEYIAIADLNDPEFLDSMDSITKKHGLSSLDNNLSLGCQLALSNTAPGILCVQAAPPIPRRTSLLLVDEFDQTSTDNEDFIFPFPLGVQPDSDAQIHFFVRNNATNVETQILPNKLDYYTLDTGGHPTTSQFITDNTAAPGGYSFFYTVVSKEATVLSGFDGYLARDPASTGNKGFFSYSSPFDSSYIGKKLKLIDAKNVANDHTNHDFTSTIPVDGYLIINDVVDGVALVGYDASVSPTFTFTPITNHATHDLAFQVVELDGTSVVGFSGTDGYITGASGTTATFWSNTINLSTLTTPTLRQLKITESTETWNGTYDILSVATDGYDGYSASIRKVFNNESTIRFEVIDPDQQSYYVVVNHNVAPNGNAIRISYVDSKDASFYDAGWLTALEALELVECDILTVLPKQTKSIIFQNALQHCKTMSQNKNKKERVLFMGAISGLKPENLTGASPAAVEDIGVLEGIQGDEITEILAGNIEDLTNYSIADSFGNTFRCVYFYPDQIVVQAGADNVLVDGFYIAAAAAGYLSAVSRVEIPLTNKVLSGFTILRNKQYSPTVQEQIAAAGATLLVPVQGGGNVVWGRTTTQSGAPEEEEISIVFIRDRIAKSMRQGFKGFIGIPEDDNTVSTLSARAIGLLTSFIAQGLITQYKDLQVQRDSVDPRQWNIAVKVQPTYPVNFIYIRVSIGTL